MLVIEGGVNAGNHLQREPSFSWARSGTAVDHVESTFTRFATK